jgi:hypothetical protein
MLLLVVDLKPNVLGHTLHNVSGVLRRLKHTSTRTHSELNRRAVIRLGEIKRFQAWALVIRVRVHFDSVQKNMTQITSCRVWPCAQRW